MKMGGNGAAHLYCCYGPGEVRTPDTRFRRPVLYPTELRGHIQTQHRIILSSACEKDNTCVLTRFNARATEQPCRYSMSGPETPAG